MSIHRVRTRMERAGRLYNDRRWRKASMAWLQQYPICMLCLAYGKINQGAMDNAIATQRSLVVDHIEPHHGDSELFWDQTNWQTLCRMPCHDRDKAKHEKAGGDAVGWYAMIRRVISEQGTQGVWERMKEWVPPPIVARVGIGG